EALEDGGVQIRGAHQGRGGSEELRAQAGGVGQRELLALRLKVGERAEGRHKAPGEVAKIGEGRGEAALDLDGSQVKQPRALANAKGLRQPGRYRGIERRLAGEARQREAALRGEDQGEVRLCFRHVSYLSTRVGAATRPLSARRG